MQENMKYQPEYNLLKDAYLGTKDILRKELNYLVNMLQVEQQDYKGTADKQIFYNCLCYTYDRIIK